MLLETKTLLNGPAEKNEKETESVIEGTHNALAARHHCGNGNDTRERSLAEGKRPISVQ